MITNNWEEIKNQYPVTVEMMVHWGDMDAADHVNNGVYLKWCETARIEFFNKVEINVSFSGDETGPILGFQDCKYISPMTFPDVARVACKVKDIQRDRLLMECLVFSKVNERLAIISNQTIIAYDYIKLIKMPIPQNWIDSINQLQSSYESE